MTRHISFAVPGDLETPTGGYAYDRRVIAELRARGWQVDVCDLGDGFPNPSIAQLAGAQEMLARTPRSAAIVIDGLAYGVMAAVAVALARTHILIALVHHPLALETGLTAGEAAALLRSEREALAQARHVIVTGPQTAQILIADYGVARDKITVASPGNDATTMAAPENDVVHFLSVGSIVPRKGYDVLLAALATLGDLRWQLTIAGDDVRNPQTTAALREVVSRNRLGDRIDFRGSLNEKDLAEAYRRADVFVTASHFEGYGMAAATAIACGLPIVATRGGALSDTLAHAGLLVAPNDTAALAGALRRVITDPDLRTQLRNASRAAAKNLPTWHTTAEQFAQAIERTA